MENIFEINYDSEIQMTVSNGSHFYFIDNFYKYPNKVVEFAIKNKPTLWKKEHKTYNGVHFEDYRHIIETKDIDEVFSYVSGICNKKPVHPVFLTNLTRFKRNEFNDYKNNYWWPHLDIGHTAIIYLDAFESGGTNIYDVIDDDYNMKYEHEHICPWRSKKYWKLKDTIKSKFNRLVLFNASKLYHGANIDDETFFDDALRLNQVMFFEP